ncbi:MAG TPA: extensin family protein [Polyangiaceae bacterium]|nr:extensin family protein [Polyangiaceae bacterium]
MLKPIAVTAGAAALFLWTCGGSMGSPKRVSSPSSDGAPQPAETTTDRSASHREWELVAAADGAACRAELTNLGIRFRELADRTEPDAQGCGIPHGVIVTKGPLGFTYAPPLQIDCSLAKELPWIEQVIQEQAEQHLGAPIKQIVTLGTFSCRKVRGGFTGRLSEHAVGNAIDFGAFVPRRGAAVSVSRDYRPLDDSPGARGLFLRGVFHGLRGHGGLTHVIGPETRSDHHDHIHIDRGEPWWHFADRLFGG